MTAKPSRADIERDLKYVYADRDRLRARVKRLEHTVTVLRDLLRGAHEIALVAAGPDTSQEVELPL